MIGLGVDICYMYNRSDILFYIQSVKKMCCKIIFTEMYVLTMDLQLPCNWSTCAHFVVGINSLVFHILKATICLLTFFLHMSQSQCPVGSILLSLRGGGYGLRWSICHFSVLHTSYASSCPLSGTVFKISVALSKVVLQRLF